MNFLDKVARYLNMNHLQITNEYKEKFMVADATFRHQIVFDPFKKKLVPLTDPAVFGTNPKYCKNAGEIFDHEQAYHIALGNLHPTTFKRLDSWLPSETVRFDNNLTGTYFIITFYFRVLPVTVYGLVVIKRVYQEKHKKPNLGEFFNSSTSGEEKVNLIEDEQIKIDEDKKIAKELEFYSRNSLVSQEATTSETETYIPGSPKEECTSPVLKRNPFIVEKKLSKFHRTTISNQIVVKSRYFASETEKTVENIEVNEESINAEYNEVSNVENIPNNEIMEMKIEDSKKHSK
ncbi:hypothetical protein NQ314_016751 [Rhamnusium bicolor]|uniref:Uncharacterized protein n=1 Tax=Rhamnusium bicolor TaxID=1586634 RepID=A0AAV8WWD1_9CUCU|nr:hypothetical protein NQ314_016751 [Rhamnusium bicolor]